MCHGRSELITEQHKSENIHVSKAVYVSPNLDKSKFIWFIVTVVSLVSLFVYVGFIIERLPTTYCLSTISGMDLDGSARFKSLGYQYSNSWNLVTFRDDDIVTWIEYPSQKRWYVHIKSTYLEIENHGCTFTLDDLKNFRR